MAMVSPTEDTRPGLTFRAEAEKARLWIRAAANILRGWRGGNSALRKQMIESGEEEELAQQAIGFFAMGIGLFLLREKCRTEAENWCRSGRVQKWPLLGT